MQSQLTMLAICSLFLDVAHQQKHSLIPSEPRHKKRYLPKRMKLLHRRIREVWSDPLFLSREVFYISEQHRLWIDCFLTEELTLHKMIQTDFILTLPNILGHKCLCIKSHDQIHLIPPRVRQEFLIPVKMSDNLVGYARISLPRPTLNFTSWVL